MPRKSFITDVKAASEQPPSRISGVSRGEEDGDVNACYTTSTGLPIELGLMVPDVGSYPSESTFLIFVKSLEVPAGVVDILESITKSSAGMTVPLVLQDISQRLNSHLATGSRDEPLLIDSDTGMAGSSELGSELGSESEDEYIGDYGSDFGHTDDEVGGGSRTAATYTLSPENALRVNKRIKEDLKAARSAGFKIGILSGMKADFVNSMVSLSIQVRRLGFSEEALQAWNLEPHQYIVLLIRYSSGYKDFAAVIDQPTKALDIAFRIGVSNKYKPTLIEALASFTDISKDAKKSLTEDEITDPTTKAAGFFSMFISSSLNEFINSEFVSLIKIRNSVAIGWDGAKRYLDKNQGRLSQQSEILPSEYYRESQPAQKSLPQVATEDHLSDHHAKQISFPLVAAQFSLRYLTRCTEFCLVCHNKIENDFEALKPYVCDRPLCLYQYMSLGFGPSVEHEILTQPYVVDLLVSFCYSSAMSRRLREYPIGMSLAVPSISSAAVTSAPFVDHSRPRGVLNTISSTMDQSTSTVTANYETETSPISYDVKYDANHQELIFEEGLVSPICNGDWIVVSQLQHHFRVEDISLYPTVKLSKDPVTRNSPHLALAVDSVTTFPASPSTSPPPVNIIATRVLAYNQNFDDMDDLSKAETITTLLETLPSITEMKTYLEHQSRTSEPNLRLWKNRISPAALGILRWIIASNRSCIVQVDKCPGQNDADLMKSRVRLDQRITNIPENWVQFRFAQGSPDKEQRFLNALKAEKFNFNARYPTIFAFHGSPLANWHSIIRTGLDFKETLHGRAFGHGVYHAQEQATSCSYAPTNMAVWQGSELKITSAMSLNEIVNCPSQYTSNHPYLVVQHVDWIQCRYLLVQVQGASDSYNKSNNPMVSAESDPSVEVDQDPARVARSITRRSIGIPLCAVSVSRDFRVNFPSEGPIKKKRKTSSGIGVPPSRDHSSLSDSEMTEDMAFLYSEGENETSNRLKSNNLVILNSSSKHSKGVFTDFIPGSLDQSSLPMLEPPAYATFMATNALNRGFKEVLEIQKNTPLHELGWYIDPDLISNIYQWIVELHSFDAELPLAKDMKSAGVTSVVLEIRFGKDYPFSPPFVRVIRPRFLPFTQGGGGHVTAGGAMCMELLTNSGWSSVSSIDSVLLQVRVAIANLDPRPARLEGQGRVRRNVDYGSGEAMEAFRRACALHGWEVPKDFQQFGRPYGPDQS